MAKMPTVLEQLEGLYSGKDQEAEIGDAEDTYDTLRAARIIADALFGHRGSVAAPEHVFEVYDRLHQRQVERIRRIALEADAIRKDRQRREKP